LVAVAVAPEVLQAEHKVQAILVVLVVVLQDIIQAPAAQVPQAKEITVVQEPRTALAEAVAQAQPVVLVLVSMAAMVV
jgi:hypothetical protein